MTTARSRPALSYDANGTPGIWARDARQAYWGIGWLHGRHRPLQSRVLGVAARGALAEYLLPSAELLRLDTLIHRLDIPARARAEAARLPDPARAWLDAYVEGYRLGVANHAVRRLRLPPLTRESVIGAFLVSAYVGQAEGQERMERALVAALTAGANPGLLEEMFAPHLENWRPAEIKAAAATPVRGFARSGGSNAWAVSRDRSASGGAWLCADPHLPVTQLPAIFFEVRARVGDDFWLGATLPGLPGIAIGRTREISWSGTFSVADNVDSTIEHVRGGRVERGDSSAPIIGRAVQIRRRFAAPARRRFYASDRGVLDWTGEGDADVLAVAWAGAGNTADSLAAYLELPLASSAAAAEAILQRTQTLSLHFVLADRSGDLRYCQVGRVPRRSAGWSGLYPTCAGRWVGFDTGADLPHSAAGDGLVVSANEGRPGRDGRCLAPFAQPSYRRDRIRELLGKQRHHDFESLRRIQLDVHSKQADLLLPQLTSRLPPGEIRDALLAWDRRYDLDSRGAHAFDQAYRTARGALAAELGGDWLRAMLDDSELGVWWCAAFDRVLSSTQDWSRTSRAHVGAALAELRGEVAPWGEVQRFRLAHLVLGRLPRLLGFGRGPFGLPGSIATVCQGNVLDVSGTTIAVAPAYRWICDLDTDEAHTALAGGIDGSRFGDSYDRWLDDWRAGRYHRIAPPDAAESPQVPG